jgi:RNA polymerase sigma-70 factor, ECF subfamily
MSSETAHHAPVTTRPEDPDTAIIERIREGETSLYEVLIRKYNQRMYRVARAFLHDEAEAQDVMQEAYLKSFTALPRFQGRARFSTWLTRILINCALAHLRSRSRRREVDLDLVDGRMEEVSAVGERGSTASEAGDLRLAQDQVSRLIEGALGAIPPKYRLVFIMRELEKMSGAETAATLGITVENTKVRLHRAKRLLREELRRQMPDLSLYGFLGDRCDALTRRVMQRISRAAAGSGQLLSGLPDPQVVDELGADVGPGHQPGKAQH